jgi:hypothetical protein
MNQQNSFALQAQNSSGRLVATGYGDMESVGSQLTRFANQSAGGGLQPYNPQAFAVANPYAGFGVVVPPFTVPTLPSVTSTPQGGTSATFRRVLTRADGTAEVTDASLCTQAQSSDLGQILSTTTRVVNGNDDVTAGLRAELKAAQALAVKNWELSVNLQNQNGQLNQEIGNLRKRVEEEQMRADKNELKYQTCEQERAHLARQLSRVQPGLSSSINPAVVQQSVKSEANSGTGKRAAEASDFGSPVLPVARRRLGYHNDQDGSSAAQSAAAAGDDVGDRFKQMLAQMGGKL